NGIAHRNEDVLDLFSNDRERMTSADAPAIPRQRYIQRFLLQCRTFLALVNRGLQSLEGCLDLYFDLIRNTTEFCALFFRKFAEALKFESEEAGLTREITSAGVL